MAHANSERDWRIYADFAQVLITRARALYVNDYFDVALAQTVYALDATTIDLCLALFPWAEFRKDKGAVKLHTLLDLRGSIPSVVIVTGGQVHEVNILDQLIWEAGAIYLMDRGYVDFRRLHRFTESLAFFVIRAKRNLDYARRSRDVTYEGWPFARTGVRRSCPRAAAIERSVQRSDQEAAAAARRAGTEILGRLTHSC